MEWNQGRDGVYLDTMKIELTVLKRPLCTRMLQLKICMGKYFARRKISPEITLKTPMKRAVAKQAKERPRSPAVHDDTTRCLCRACDDTKASGRTPSSRRGPKSNYEVKRWDTNKKKEDISVFNVLSRVDPC